MARFTHILLRLGAGAALVGSYVFTTACAVRPSEALSGTPSELQAKADYYAKGAAEYRARMRTDEKRAILYFTLANRWDQQAERYHLAALAAAGEPVYRG